MALPVLIIFLGVCLTMIMVPFAQAISYRVSDLINTRSNINSELTIPWLGGLPLLFTLGVLIVIGIKLSEALILSESGILIIIFTKFVSIIVTSL